MRFALDLAERGYLPDPILRLGIRQLLKERIRSERPEPPMDSVSKTEAFVEFLSRSPIAIETSVANDQHYEVPTDYFRLVLGPRLKYSCCLWEEDGIDLDGAEQAMLELTATRAGIEEGQSVLDLGCGWGSLSLWLAERYPGSKVTAVSNSATQRTFIQSEAVERGLENLEVVTCDMNRFSTSDRYDRIVSVEMLEHLRNYGLFLSRVREWLARDGAFFAHIFCHREWPYAFEPESDSDWMAKFFFTGGIMPSKNLLRQFEEDLCVADQWDVGGEHYSKTLEAWLRNHDCNREEILEIFSRCYGESAASIWFHRWRIFYLACSELFGFNQGSEWFVGHYLMRPQ